MAKTLSTDLVLLAVTVALLGFLIARHDGVWDALERQRWPALVLWLGLAIPSVLSGWVQQATRTSAGSAPL